MSAEKNVHILFIKCLTNNKFTFKITVFIKPSDRLSVFFLFADMKRKKNCTRANAMIWIHHLRFTFQRSHERKDCNHWALNASVCFKLEHCFAIFYYMVISNRTWTQHEPLCLISIITGRSKSWCQHVKETTDQKQFWAVFNDTHTHAHTCSGASLWARGFWIELPSCLKIPVTVIQPQLANTSLS